MYLTTGGGGEGEGLELGSHAKQELFEAELTVHRLGTSKYA